MDRVVVDENGCWLYQGYPNPESGYGQVTGGVEFPPRTWTAHVAVWVYFNGPVPDGLVLDHLCRVRHCCNPGHLETSAENSLRGDAPRIVLSRANRCEKGHSLTPENTYAYPKSGRRRCRTCRDEYMREYRADMAGVP